VTLVSRLEEHFLVKVLVTGGAGFIGSHTVDALLEKGHEIRVFDNLEPQVHGAARQPPRYLNREAELVVGDVRDQAALASALKGVQAVYHLAAATGVGQSMYQIAGYTDVNVLGTANLLDLLTTNRSCSVEKLVLASSRAVYGEGAGFCERCGKQVSPGIRSLQQLEDQKWDVTCPLCAGSVKPLPTTEDDPATPTSVYAISKMAQENLCLCVGQSYHIPVVVLRYFNVYGPRQSLSNPYTGIITSFVARILNGKAPEIYEDGLMTRDFVHVSDAVQANLLALETEAVNGEVLNIGTQSAISVLEVAQLIVEWLGADVEPEIIGRFRMGDIRHCTANVSKARRLLDYSPRIPTLHEGIGDVLDAALQLDPDQLYDRSEQAQKELSAQGLFR
jgi:dTDP-L-rhamnose 4-epimerase